MLSELNENRGRQLNKIKENNFLKMRILTGIQIIKKNQTNSGAQKYHNWIENSPQGFNIRPDQAEERIWTWRQIISNYWVRWGKRKKNEESEHV